MRRISIKVSVSTADLLGLTYYSLLRGVNDASDLVKAELVSYIKPGNNWTEIYFSSARSSSSDLVNGMSQRLESSVGVPAARTG